MKHHPFNNPFPVCSIAAAAILSSITCAHAMDVGKLRCESLTNPLGIDETQPRLSWVVESDQRAQHQTAYQVVVTSDNETLWDSTKIVSGETSHIAYTGKPLISEMRCSWKVKVWDQDGKESAWSQPATWTMGLLQEADWKAEWIGYDKLRNAIAPAAPKAQVLPPPVYLRTEFKTGKPITRATLSATGLGIFDIHLNGRRATDDWFNPGWTDYTKRVYYRTYDVTSLLKHGDNKFDAVLADGWYSGYVGYGNRRDHYGKQPRVKARLRIEYADGTSDVIATGPNWKAAAGPILTADFLQGETCDARIEPDNWEPVNTGAEVHPVIQAHPGPPVVVIREFKAKSINEPVPGNYVLDLGQNFAGVARLKVTGQPGQKITLRFAERLNPDGTIYTANLRGARATDSYICRGTGDEEWTPRFTFHGFQYIEVTGLTKPPTPDTVVGLALSTNTPVAGSFECSDPMLNQLHNNICWTQRANFIDVPTDCPQRDERLGWTGDAQVYVRTATLNSDVETFFRKWLVDLMDSQRADGQFPCVAPLKVAGPDGGPAWADAGVICPWTMYAAYGDKRILERCYPQMQKFIAFCKQRSKPDLTPPDKFHCFGDWLSIKADTPKDVIFLAYFAYSVQLTAQTAEALGKKEDAAQYHKLFDDLKATFNKAYVAADGRIKGNTQCAYVLAIAFDLLDADKMKLAAKYLVDDIESRDNHLSTGFIGTKDLMLALAKIGRNDVAYRLLHNDTFPSWGFSIKHGATSIWERWNGWTPEQGFGAPSMNSFAHYSFGAVYQWMVENIAGIRSDGPAYKQLIIAPQPGGKLTHANTRYQSVHGEIVSNWKLENRKLTMDITIPANTTATVCIPAKNEGVVLESGKPAAKASGVKFLRMEKDRAVYGIGSGVYKFESVNE